MTEVPLRKLICGVEHERRPCSKCGEPIWFQCDNPRFPICTGCSKPTLAYRSPMDTSTGGGRRVSHKGSQES